MPSTVDEGIPNALALPQIVPATLSETVSVVA
jgi:hypothetical protein